MSITNEKNRCCGCGACAAVCPCDSIKMVSDSEGFLYPEVNLALCCECGQCEDVCGFNHENDFYDIKRAYAARHRDKEVCAQSSSGGIFTAISDWVLAQNGIIVGAAYIPEERTVAHKIARDKQSRDEMRGSKYVQSVLGDAFSWVKKNLEENRIVLFVGTSCQVHGLRNYLRDVDCTGLVLCDIVCHGAPSPDILSRYIEFIEKKNKTHIIELRFRDKRKGWSKPTAIAKAENREFSLQYYSNIFYRDCALRLSCYECPYASLKRVSDITIGDFWGVENDLPQMYSEEGVSLVFVNTERGQYVMNKIKDKLIYEECAADSCKQKNLYKPTERPDEREKFWEDYMNLGFEEFLSRYADYGIKASIRIVLRKVCNRMKKVWRAL